MQHMAQPPTRALRLLSCHRTCFGGCQRTWTLRSLFFLVQTDRAEREGFTEQRLSETTYIFSRKVYREALYVRGFRTMAIISSAQLWEQTHKAEAVGTAPRSTQQHTLKGHGLVLMLLGYKSQQLRPGLGCITFLLPIYTLGGETLPLSLPSCLFIHTKHTKDRNKILNFFNWSFSMQRQKFLKLKVPHLTGI